MDKSVNKVLVHFLMQHLYFYHTKDNDKNQSNTRLVHYFRLPATVTHNHIVCSQHSYVSIVT